MWTGYATAFPLSLQVQLGNGSWDSSLIQPLADDAEDWVTFDLLVVLKWPRNPNARTAELFY